MARKITTEERQNYIARQRGHDPHVTKENYNRDLMWFLNYHNKNTEDKTIRKWALDYQTKRNAKDVPALAKASDFELRSIGMIARAIAREEYISPEHVNRINNDIDELIAKYKGTKTETVEVQKPTVVDRTKELASKHIAEVEGAIDEYLVNGTEFSMKGYLVSNNVSGPVAKQVAQFMVRRQTELKEAVEGKDAQLKEAYSHLGKVKLKRFLGLIQQIIVDCAQQVVTNKVRKPRVKKEKPAAVQVAKLKYMKEFKDMSLTSESPEGIIGAEQVWLYDTAKRKVYVYSAETGQKLGVKGTTITGFSVAESGGKTLRKPEDFVKGNLAKRTINATFKSLKTKVQAVNGRTNENVIILKVFK